MDPSITSFHLTIVSPDKLILETDAVKVIVPGMVQELAILPNHTPLYSQLIQGTIKVFVDSKNSKELDIEGGILRVRQNQVSIIVGFDADIESPKKPKLQ